MTWTMRAISQDQLGGPEVLREVRLPVPDVGPSQVLVRVRAAGVNPSDWKHRAQVIYLKEPPFILGWDVSGTVEAIGRGVTLFRPGDEVFGMLPYPHGVGSHAEYVVAPARCLALKPRSVSHEEAGAAPLAALTAYQALVDTAHVQAGHRVLIHGAAGGVGHLAVQIAKARGAHVTGTASAPKHDFLETIGVDEVLDYRRPDIQRLKPGFDVVLDTVGGYVASSLPLTRAGGSVVTIRPGGTAGLQDEATLRGVNLQMLIVESDHHGMNEIAKLLANRQIRVAIAAIFPLSQAAKAHEFGESNRTVGKLVLTVD